MEGGPGPAGDLSVTFFDLSVTFFRLIVSSAISRRTSMAVDLTLEDTADFWDEHTWDAGEAGRKMSNYKGRSADATEYINDVSNIGVLQLVVLTRFSLQ